MVFLDEKCQLATFYRGGSKIFREGGLSIEVISEAGGLGAQPPRSYRVY